MREENGDRVRQKEGKKGKMHLRSQKTQKFDRKEKIWKDACDRGRLAGDVLLSAGAHRGKTEAEPTRLAAKYSEIPCNKQTAA